MGARLHDWSRWIQLHFFPSISKAWSHGLGPSASAMRLWELLVYTSAYILWILPWIHNLLCWRRRRPPRLKLQKESYVSCPSQICWNAQDWECPRKLAMEHKPSMRLSFNVKLTLNLTDSKIWNLKAMIRTSGTIATRNTWHDSQSLAQGYIYGAIYFCAFKTKWAVMHAHGSVSVPFLVSASICEVADSACGLTLCDCQSMRLW